MASRAPFRTNILIPKALYTELTRALRRRKKLDASAGRETSAAVSAWVREKAHETIAAFK